ncbi:hypothetical protein FN976_17040 [Caenimonas sedimenti]|uniref:DUF2946 domain-containing protein n=1 Tax=Caenimonas sedimenti TaxID=2596921 RepID=A0A562ZP08_9BURK|nr:hypothetical protein [Caenimonas sedimenti]TWO70045.1 hypothetical protein FN976_17040 [Caenimonas sedimenti]
MAALPLQGMAAASMLFCGSQAAARVAQTASHQGHHASMNKAGHDHAAHGHAAPQVEAAQVEAAQADGAAPAADNGSQQSHSCPICASCSQAQAVGGFSSLPPALPASSAEPSQPAVRVSSQTPTLPDKPPRA